MKHTIIALSFAVAFLYPSVSSAALTHNQANAILLVLAAFGVDQPTINHVALILEPPVVPALVLGSTETPTEPQQAPQAAPTPITPTQPTVTENTTPALDPLIIRKVELSPGGYLRAFTNKAITATVSAGSLAEPLVDNYPELFTYEQDDKTWTEHVYEFKLTGAKKPFTATFTDQDGQTFSTIVK